MTGAYTGIVRPASSFLASARTRYTDAMPIPVRRAISARCKPFSIELDHLGGLGACGRLPALVFPILLGLRYPFALALQQKSALEFGNGRQHGDHQLAGRAPCVDPLTAHAEHDQTDATAIKIVHDPQQVGGTPGKAIRLAAHQGIPTADEPQSLAETIALRHSRHLLREDFLATGSREVSDLRVQSSLLLAGRCSRVAHQNAGHGHLPPIA